MTFTDVWVAVLAVIGSIVVYGGIGTLAVIGAVKILGAICNLWERWLAS